MKERHILVYFDFSCPFCYNEWTFMKQVRPMANLVENYVGWEIHPNVPAEGAVINFPGREKMVEQLNELGAPVGIKAGDMPFVYNSRKALQILEEAKKQGVMHEYIDAVFYTYFEEQRNIYKDEVILDIAEKAGVENAKAVLDENMYVDVVEQHNRDAEAIPLEYVPTIIEDGKIILSGVLTLEDILQEFGMEEEA